jgi:hypothetical protein
MISDADVLSCTHCSIPLVRGQMNFYVVNVEAVADASIQHLEDLDAVEIRRQIEALLKRLESTTGEAAMTQVCHRMILYLCYPCYQQWIANPTNAVK